MKKGEVMIYRIKQFIYALTAKMTKEDIAYVKCYLNKKEQELFFKLKVYEQSHCLKVAQSMAKQGEALNAEDKRELVRMGLLHDIGKIKYPLNLIEKSLIVILDKVTKGKIKNWHKLKMVKCYYHHAEAGYDLLSELDDYKDTFLQAIRYHHTVTFEDEKIKLLKQCDDVA